MGITSLPKCDEHSSALLLGFERPMKRTRKTSLVPRRTPAQPRAQQTVEDILTAATRVFQREGWGATTNRIAKVAGIGIGSLYEYFPNKRALLVALAERHVSLAESALARALSSDADTRTLLMAIQAAILESQRFPSHAVALIEDVPQIGSELRDRVAALRIRVLATLQARAENAGLDEPALRARAAFAAVGELTSRAMYEEPEQLDRLKQQFLAMALSRLE
jgi:AcrR family transcriptional regulator